MTVKSVVILTAFIIARKIVFQNVKNHVRSEAAARAASSSVVKVQLLNPYTGGAIAFHCLKGLRGRLDATTYDRLKISPREAAFHLAGSGGEFDGFKAHWSLKIGQKLPGKTSNSTRTIKFVKSSLYPLFVTHCVGPDLDYQNARVKIWSGLMKTKHRLSVWYSVRRGFTLQ